MLCAARKDDSNKQSHFADAHALKCVRLQRARAREISVSKRVRETFACSQAGYARRPHMRTLFIRSKARVDCGHAMGEKRLRALECAHKGRRQTFACVFLA